MGAKVPQKFATSSWMDALLFIPLISLSLLVQEAKTLKKLCVRSSRSNLKSLLRSTIRSTNDDDHSLFLPTSVLVTGLKPQRRLGLARSCASVGNFIHKIKSPPHCPCPCLHLLRTRPTPAPFLCSSGCVCVVHSIYIFLSTASRVPWWCWCRLKLSAASIPRTVTKIPKSDWWRNLHASKKVLNFEFKQRFCCMGEITCKTLSFAVELWSSVLLLSLLRWRARVWVCCPVSVDSAARLAKSRTHTPILWRRFLSWLALRPSPGRTHDERERAWGSNNQFVASSRSERRKEHTRSGMWHCVTSGVKLLLFRRDTNGVTKEVRWRRRGSPFRNSCANRVKVGESRLRVYTVVQPLSVIRLWMSWPSESTKAWKKSDYGGDKKFSMNAKRARV